MTVRQRPKTQHRVRPAGSSFIRVRAGPGGVMTPGRLPSFPLLPDTPRGTPLTSGIPRCTLVLQGDEVDRRDPGRM